MSEAGGEEGADVGFVVFGDVDRDPAIKAFSLAHEEQEKDVGCSVVAPGAFPSPRIALGPFLLPCHKAPGYEANRRAPNLLQCAGAATYRANIGVADRMPPALLRLPADREAVFADAAELLAHHVGWPVFVARVFLHDLPPAALLLAELRKIGVQVVPDVPNPTEEEKP